MTSSRSILWLGVVALAAFLSPATAQESKKPRPPAAKPAEGAAPVQAPEVIRAARP